MGSLERPGRCRVTLALTIVAVAAFAAGLYIGGQNRGTHTGITVDEGMVNENKCVTMSFINNITLIFDNVMHALDTARATFFFVDEHASIEDMIKNMGATVPEDLKNTMLARQSYFANLTVHLLDMALKYATELKPVGDVSNADLKLLQDKISEMKQLAVQLRTIAYKPELTDNDVYNARAIVKNMKDITNDIYSLTRQLIIKVG